MAKWVFWLGSLILMNLVGCQSLTQTETTTTTIGTELGSVDLRSTLPAGVSAPANPSVQNSIPYEAEFSIGDTNARVQLRWYSLIEGEHQYLIAATAELIEGAEGVELDANFSQDVTNIGTEDEVITESLVEIIPSDPAVLDGDTAVTVAYSADGAWRIVD